MGISIPDLDSTPRPGDDTPLSPLSPLSDSSPLPFLFFGRLFLFLFLLLVRFPCPSPSEGTQCCLDSWKEFSSHLGYGCFHCIHKP